VVHTIINTLLEPFNCMDPEGIVWMRHFLRLTISPATFVLHRGHRP
jgi:hypothetical protein